MPSLAPAELATLRAFHAALRRALPGVVKEVRLFGSRAHATARPDSDWDLAVIVEPEAASDQAFRDAVSDTSLDFLLRGWPIHGVVMTTAMLDAGAASRADAVGDVARHGVPIG